MPQLLKIILQIHIAFWPVLFMFIIIQYLNIQYVFQIYNILFYCFHMCQLFYVQKWIHFKNPTVLPISVTLHQNNFAFWPEDGNLNLLKHVAL